jgi:putative FmdB family regulatory protein
MPTYDYACSKCGHRFELFHSIRDEAVKKCPKCRARAKRVPSAGGGLLFKGSGFYITDYRSDSYRKGAKSEGSGGSGTGSSGGAGGSGDSGGSKGTPGGDKNASGGSKSGGDKNASGGSKSGKD